MPPWVKLPLPQDNTPITIKIEEWVDLDTVGRVWITATRVASTERKHQYFYQYKGVREAHEISREQYVALAEAIETLQYDRFLPESPVPALSEAATSNRRRSLG